MRAPRERAKAMASRTAPSDSSEPSVGTRMCLYMGALLAEAESCTPRARVHPLARGRGASSRPGRSSAGRSGPVLPGFSGGTAGALGGRGVSQQDLGANRRATRVTDAVTAVVDPPQRRLDPGQLLL